jgi:hypothetical protein
MKSRILAIFGIGTYILSVLSSATDLEGNSVVPISLIVISGIATIVFYAMATIRLWKIQKSAPILLISLAVILAVLSIIQGIAPLLLNIVRIINLIAFIWVISLLWTMGKYERQVSKLQKDSGLTDEEVLSVQENLKKGDRETAIQTIAKAQERNRRVFKVITGIDANDIIPVIGKDISWMDIANHVFRVLEFDRSGTTIDSNNKVKATSLIKPYGYLLAESPILNNKVRMPIIHRDDFWLAASVFDEPKLATLVEDGELLVTYAPKYLLPKGLSGTPHHALHYVITPRGTLDSYYSKDNDMYIANPNPQKLFGPFVYQGEIKVQINQEPEL